MEIFGYEISIWRICFIVFIICIAGCNYYLASKIEGFQSGDKNLFDPLVACPALRTSIDSHKTLLEGFTTRDAVNSMEQAKQVLELLSASYTKHGCETAESK
jgi:hypothetical protein